MIFLGWFNSARKEERLQEWCSSEKFWNSSCDLVSCGQLNVCFTRQWKARCFCTGKEAAFAGVIRGISFLKHLLPYTIFTRPLPVLHIVTQSQSPPRRQGLEIATYKKTKKSCHLQKKKKLPLTESRAVAGEEAATLFSRWKAGRWTLNNQHSYEQVNIWNLNSMQTREEYWALTSSLSFLISVPSSSQCRVYCHFAVFSLSTTSSASSQSEASSTSS